MSTQALMSVEEYLHTGFEGSDREYVDGEIVERNIGELGHSAVHGQLIYLLRQAKGRFQILPEIRIRVNSSRYRIPDIGVWLPGDIGDRIPTVPPFLAIEILSPDDRWTRVHPKITEYLSIGVQWIWVIDLVDKQALYFSQSNPAGSVCDVLRTENPAIEIPLADVLAPQA